MQSEAAFLSRDLTAENLFASSIEGPEVDGRGRLFATNFGREGTIGLVYSDGRCETFITLPGGSASSSIRFDSHGRMLLADYRGHNVLVVEPASREPHIYVHSDAFNQPNDMAITRDDVLYISDPNWSNGSGQLWRLDRSGLLKIADAMGTTNGIELSPDERTLYVSESHQRRIWAFDVVPSGLSGKRLFAEFSAHGLDGLKCDREGNLYVTRYGNGSIVVLSPTGQTVREIALKGKDVSNLVFGGADGRSVFVTLQDRKSIETFRVVIPGKRF